MCIPGLKPQCTVHALCESKKCGLMGKLLLCGDRFRPFKGGSPRIQNGGPTVL
jgi:hypothetical protein